MRCAGLLAAVVFFGASWAAAAENVPDKEKTSYLQRAEAELEALDAKVQSLHRRSQQAGADTRDELDKQIQVLESKMKIAREKVQELKGAGADRWSHFRAGIESAMRDVKHAYRKTTAFFKRKKIREDL